MSAICYVCLIPLHPFVLSTWYRARSTWYCIYQVYQGKFYTTSEMTWKLRLSDSNLDYNPQNFFLSGDPSGGGPPAARSAAELTSGTF